MNSNKKYNTFDIQDYSIKKYDNQNVINFYKNEGSKKNGSYVNIDQYKKNSKQEKLIPTNCLEKIIDSC